MDTRANHFVDVLGRLKPRVSLTQANADLSLIAERIKQQAPENAGIDVTMLSWLEATVGGVRPILMLLFGAVALVLMIACTNVANLVLARSAARSSRSVLRSVPMLPSEDRLTTCGRLLRKNGTDRSLGSSLSRAWDRIWNFPGQRYSTNFVSLTRIVLKRLSNHGPRYQIAIAFNTPVSLFDPVSLTAFELPDVDLAELDPVLAENHW